MLGSSSHPSPRYAWSGSTQIQLSPWPRTGTSSSSVDTRCRDFCGIATNQMRAWRRRARALSLSALLSASAGISASLIRSACRGRLTSPAALYGRQAFVPRRVIPRGPGSHLDGGAVEEPEEQSNVLIYSSEFVASIVDDVGPLLVLHVSPRCATGVKKTRELGFERPVSPVGRIACSFSSSEYVELNRGITQARNRFQNAGPPPRFFEAACSRTEGRPFGALQIHRVGSLGAFREPVQNSSRVAKSIASGRQNP